jgi:ribonuclease HI
MSIVYFTDASRKGGKSGIGIYCETTKQRWLARAVNNNSDVDDNNCAELMAIHAALSESPTTKEIKIYTDSSRAISFIEKVKKGNKSCRKPNASTMTKIAEKIVRISNEFPKVNIEFIKGHNNNKGNEIADHLARRGRMSKITYHI